MINKELDSKVQLFVLEIGGYSNNKPSSRLFNKTIIMIFGIKGVVGFDIGLPFGLLPGYTNI